MEMKMERQWIAICFGGAAALVLLIWAWEVLNWVWPKKLEKCLRVQGLKGNSYRPFLGDQYESGKLIREALSKPININADIKDRVIPHILKTFRDHGKNSFMWVGRIPRVHITEPEQIREVLTKYYRFQKNHHSFDPITKHLLTGIGSLEGEPWAKHRRVINAAFHFEKLKLMLPAFYESCHDLVSKWESKVPDSGSAEVEVWHDIETLTADVISRTLFGSNYEEGKRIFELMRELTVLTIQVIRSVYIPGRRFLPTKRNNRIRAIDKEARVRIKGIINNKMKAMKAGEVTSDDFLGILFGMHVNEIQQGNYQSAGMRIEEIIGECKLFYFAGQDSTSTLLVWTMVILSRFPEWQARAREEVLQAFGDKKPDYDGISRLKIVTMILYEVRGLDPPGGEGSKVAHEATKSGGVSIPAGVQAMFPPILLHQDPEIWGKDAREFKPERFWEGVLKATKNQGSFFPFSLGPGMSMGQNFALWEAKMPMALILLPFSFELSPSYKHTPLTLITLQPQHGAHLVLHRA
uniref:Secologanin synthase n=1 Tax=Nothapodytes nimmoniana TaxID=159386 RepID=A0A0N6YK55_NOTNI|nr:secologanin synthase [Nothapodytes nimmoniana]